MSWIRPAGLSLSNGARCAFTGSYAVSGRRVSTPSTAQARRVDKGLETPISSPISRSFSTSKTASNTGQASRFKRPETPSAETPISPRREKPTVEPRPEEADVSESVISSNSETNTTPTVATFPPPRGWSSAKPTAQTTPRKPIDTSSKEYKEAASKYIRFVVGLPFLLVTSYFLYQRREYLGQLEARTQIDQICVVEPQVKFRIVDSNSPSSQASNPGN
ncbi:hypothetical protein P885DRAFT_41549 [Corynascus similis CBS 632.67]